MCILSLPPFLISFLTSTNSSSISAVVIPKSLVIIAILNAPRPWRKFAPSITTPIQRLKALPFHFSSAPRKGKRGILQLYIPAWSQKIKCRLEDCQMRLKARDQHSSMDVVEFARKAQGSSAESTWKQRFGGTCSGCIGDRSVPITAAVGNCSANSTAHIPVPVAISRTCGSRPQDCQSVLDRVIQRTGDIGYVEDLVCSC